MKSRKKQSLTALQRLSNMSQIPVDTVLSRPFIKMHSNREIVIEDAGKLLHYDTESVRVRQYSTVIIIHGKDLILRCLANNDLRVTGFISSVSFE